MVLPLVAPRHRGQGIKKRIEVKYTGARRGCSNTGFCQAKLNNYYFCHFIVYLPAVAYITSFFTSFMEMVMAYYRSSSKNSDIVRAQKVTVE